VIAGLGALGAFVSGLQVMLFALAASVYPAANRATGVGAALAIGRTGAVVSSYTGAAVLGYGASAYFSAIAISMFAVTGALAMVRNHSAPRRCVA
jgi:AAHS family 4-hydroxybenzoate transporter-like MFS transporter